MNLIYIGSPNLLINPEQIEYIEQRTIGVTSVTYVCVGNREFILGIPLDEFYKVLRLKEDENKVTQGFAG